ncbi:hypothetical protein [Acidianus bottle-shaped virus 2 strain ABV2]|uniref:Uncharacterized protein n=1 Tax=Acidianus bottle-shaped virus 2 strain ABV2 TaxID=1732173 RepID=A0A0N9P6W9_9VIRU|nr:hypothetical protein AVU01_gp01 [Acidianus bottle-shaped virus 2 strain ABV2]YP_009211324.1 hypothetical protein AVU01_gp54 [Acidianus bottle-shaped virus 2 strain ABV2]ALG96749.1 hypothetical protein [Acidianus bottle-shaped virus 2 strain ABV2]ALG96802.1 hypothetical protein [Acidianus bottle-shaped virus 2 strain ABV2]
MRTNKVLVTNMPLSGVTVTGGGISTPTVAFIDRQVSAIKAIDL